MKKNEIINAHDLVKTYLLKKGLFYLYHGLVSALKHPETAETFKGPVQLLKSQPYVRFNASSVTAEKPRCAIG